MHSARIVAHTTPVIPTLNPGQFVAYVARVSNPQNQESHATGSKLLRYLVKHRHWSPFEMAHVVMEIETTRDIARQILRHRSFSFQEFSQRYADPTAALGFSLRDARLQDDRNRQNSLATDDAELQTWWTQAQAKTVSMARHLYDEAISRGIAKEQARSLLPEGLTVSRLYMAGSLRSWMHYCELRTGPETQAEHRAVARSAWSTIVDLYPDIADAVEVR